MRGVAKQENPGLITKAEAAILGFPVAGLVAMGIIFKFGDQVTNNSAFKMLSHAAWCWFHAGKC